MFKLKFGAIGFFSLGLTLISSPTQALPGQTTDEAVAWINANPTLRPAIGNGLVVKKSNTPSQRFNFQASLLPPGRIDVPRNRTTIRSERYAFFDMINGVTLERLVTSLRIIYGVDIYQDYQQSQIIFNYPTQEMINRSRRQNLPLLEARKGQLRLGNRYAYWLEIVETENGIAFDGQMTVFLKEDLEKFAAELQSR